MAHPDEELKRRKNLVLCNIYFFALLSLLCIGSYQYASEVPNWLSLFSLCIMTGNVFLFIYGWVLLRKNTNRYRFGQHYAAFLFLISVQLFLTSNIVFIVDVNESGAYETVNYPSFSSLEYIIIVLILSGVFYFVSSPKMFFKEIETTSQYLWAILSAVGGIAVVRTVLYVIQAFVFNNIEVIKSAQQFLLVAIILGFGAVAVFILLYRAKNRELQQTV